MCKSMARLAVFVALAVTVVRIEAARILAILATPSLSHHVFYNRYLLELNKRGHDITVATPYPVDATNLTNYKQLDFSDFREHWSKGWEGKLESGDTRRSFMKIAYFVTKLFLDLIDKINSHPEMRRIREKEEMFDVYITEWTIVNPFFSYTKYANYSIRITSFAFEPLPQYAFGGTSSPAYVPNTGLGYSDHMTFLQRLNNTIHYIVTQIIIFCMNFAFDMKNREYFGQDFPSLMSLEKDADLVLSNSHFTTQTPRPFTPNIIEVGGRQFYLEGYKPNPLPQDLQRFLDAAEEGVIYFSLGSNVKSRAMPIEKRQIFIQTFSRMKQKVLWKWEDDTLPGKPDNVKVGKWLPQTEILAHPNVKVFVTQGGLQSVSEAVYFKVPMVVIPFFADQELNAKKLSSERVGIHVDYETLDAESFRSALEKIINDSGYKERMAKYSALTQDQPQSPLDRAVWWTEYVIRHKGARHLRPASVDMPWYQYFLLDVFAFILVVLSIVFYTTYKIFGFTLRLLLGKNKVKEE